MAFLIAVNTSQRPPPPLQTHPGLPRPSSVFEADLIMDSVQGAFVAPTGQTRIDECISGPSTTTLTSMLSVDKTNARTRISSGDAHRPGTGLDPSQDGVFNGGTRGDW